MQRSYGAFSGRSGCRLAIPPWQVHQQLVKILDKNIDGFFLLALMSVDIPVNYEGQFNSIYKNS
jgi:hypothetical protein